MKICIPCVAVFVVCVGAAVLIGYGQNRGETLREPGKAEVPAAVAEASRRQSADVQIENFTFRPRRLTLPVGTRVTWTNHDDVPHTVAAVDKTFRSGTLDTDDAFSFVFSQAGTYSYFCGVHPHMTGEIVVEPTKE